MLASKTLYQRTLTICELTEKVSQVSVCQLPQKSFTLELSGHLINDSILLKSSIRNALYKDLSVRRQNKMVQFALILVRNLQYYLKGLEYDSSLPSDYTKTMLDELRKYHRYLLMRNKKWNALLN